MRLLRLIIFDLTISNCILQQIVLINRRCRSAVERLTQTKIHSTGRHYEKNFKLKNYISRGLH